ncbi:hypothetical protein [Microcystis phage Mwe-JY25]
MSYDWMDHAQWVEDSARAFKMRAPTARERRQMKDRRGWHAAPEHLNPFQRRAVTILGVIGGGIYNAPINWDSMLWQPTYLVLTWRGSLSTVDFCRLSWGVFLAHDAAIRLEISPAMKDLQICLHERWPSQPGDHFNTGHPTLENAFLAHRERFPPHHHVHFAPASAPEDALQMERAR